jgi:ribosomal protein S20
MKTAVKKVLAAQDGKKGDVALALRSAESMIRHVAAKGVIPKKRASRKIARLARRIHAAQA